MTIRSMTGFGRGEAASGMRVWVAEVRSVNNRYLDIKIKLPRGYAPLEEKVRQLVMASHGRGRVDLFVAVSGDFSDLEEVKVNLPLARAYFDGLQEIAREFSCANPLTAQSLAAYPEVLIREQRDEDLDQVWPLVEQAVGDALAACTAMRTQEGEALATDLNSRLAFFAETVAAIEIGVPELVRQRRHTLQERLEKLLGNVQLDQARLAQEVALMADKTDVTEEIVRLRSHLEQFGRFLEESGGVGRKLDFLIQEFLREVNTLAAKITDAAVAHRSVELKSELEKIREQVQNIE
jgi:uncharacterized protein (TIGR00255 family)